MATREAYDDLQLRWNALIAPALTEVLRIIEKVPEDERTDLAAFDLGEHVRCGEAVLAESYLKLPSLSALSPSDQMEIIFTELHFRRGDPSRDPPRLEDYLNRFPFLEDEIRKQFDFDAILDITGLRDAIDEEVADLIKFDERFDRN